MRNTPLPNKSPFLEGLWQGVLTKYGWNMKDLQRETGLSYNYVRHIADGKIIPSRNALWRMCGAVGLDFERVWDYLNSIDQLTNGEEQERQVGAEIAATLVPKRSAKDTAVQSALGTQLIGIFERLPLAAQYSLMAEACKLAEENNVNVPGLLNPYRVPVGPFIT
jgi:transcriptional regulator with XRE-family HTH domain